MVNIYKYGRELELINDINDRYKLGEIIGKGSFGKVLLVRRREDGRVYALKTLRKVRCCPSPMMLGPPRALPAPRICVVLVNSYTCTDIAKNTQANGHRSGTN